MGAIEAALVAVLTSIGVDSAEALSTVVLFGLLTYWLPVLPPWMALRRVMRAAGVASTTPTRPAPEAAPSTTALSPADRHAPGMCHGG